MTATLRAAVWMTGAIASFTAMAVAGRAASIELDTFEIMLYRSAIGFAVVLAVAGAAGRLGEVTTRHMGVHALRNLCHFTGQNLWFFAITVLPLAQVFALEFTSPLWAIVLGALILGERLTAVRVLAGLVGFAGILLVTRPSPETLSPGLVAAAAAAVGFAGSAVFTRMLTRTETTACILFWLTGMQLVLGLGFAGVDGDIALPSAGAWPMVVIIALAGLLAHFCLTSALALAPAGIVMPMDFVRLPVIAVIGMAFYSEPLDLFVLAGAALIFAANAVNIASESRAEAGT